MPRPRTPTPMLSAGSLIVTLLALHLCFVTAYVNASAQRRAFPGIELSGGPPVQDDSLLFLRPASMAQVPLRTPGRVEPYVHSDQIQQGRMHTCCASFYCVCSDLSLTSKSLNCSFPAAPRLRPSFKPNMQPTTSDRGLCNPPIVWTRKIPPLSVDC